MRVDQVSGVGALMATNVIVLLHRDFLLKPELLRAISDLGFEHPSEGMYHVDVC